jgi:hypothetical protein
VATVVSVSTTGTTVSRATASAAATTGSFLTNLQSRSPADWTVLAGSPSTISNLAAQTNGASRGTAALSPSAPLFSGLVAAALRQEQEIPGSLQAAQTGAVATKAYLATGERNRTKTASDTNLTEIFTPGMPAPQASGRLLDLVV